MRRMFEETLGETRFDLSRRNAWDAGKHVIEKVVKRCLARA